MLLSFTLVFLHFTDSLIFFLQYVCVVQTEEQSHFGAGEGPATRVQRGRVRHHEHVLRGDQGRERGRVQAAARPRHVAKVLDELSERRRQCRVLQVRHLACSTSAEMLS